MSTLVVADSRGVFLAGLEWVLREAGHTVVADCHSTADVLAHAERHRPDIVIIGLAFADREAAGLAPHLRAGNSALRIIFILQQNGILQQHGEFDVKEIQGLDADGLLLDGASHNHLVECVVAVEAGRKWIDPTILHHLLTPRAQHQPDHKLTGRETEVVGLVSRGLRNKTIAQQLHVSEGTVKMHLHHVYEKLHLGSRAELAWMALGDGGDWPGPGRNGVH